MYQRIITSIFALPILFFFVLKGGVILSSGACAISVIGLFEFYRSFKGKNISPMCWIGYAFTVIIFGLLYFEIGISYYMMMFFVMIILMLGQLVFIEKHSVVDVAVTLLGFLYITFPFSHILLITKFNVSYVIWYVFIIAWGSDTFAYFIGKAFGKRKLIPSVSPNKTVAGSIGGIGGAVLGCIILSYIFNKDFIGYSAVLGLVGGALSQLGDLIASKIKRLNGIKDFGNLMPGHGGVLDRFDSILITAPIVYYVLLISNLF